MLESNNETLTAAIAEILALIDRERENEIVSRRFGLEGRRETLEAVGDDMGITRERVRQIEKVALERLREKLGAGKSKSFEAAEKLVIRELAEAGRAARVTALAEALTGKTDAVTTHKVHLITELIPKLTALTENNNYYQGAIITPREDYEEKDLRNEIDKVVAIIKKNHEPMTADEMFEGTDYETPSNITALASLSKNVTSLGEKWGLISWPAVNPKNIRDKIYVILSENKRPMHYADLAEAIRKSKFRRSRVTRQAVHNELIKDSRFVLVGRGIYALGEWGYKKGTITDVITEILKEHTAPMERKEIVKAALKKRQVRESTILLNLQNKPQFKRVGKALYALDETAA
jgi:predicted Zn-ribbon and HTH transcriptional regulator